MMYCVDTGDQCRLKWKALKDYYFRVKKAGKGKSGDGAKRKKPWIYYSAMDRLLSAFNEENDRLVLFVEHNQVILAKFK